jgi:hypothetical protein
VTLFQQHRETRLEQSRHDHQQPGRHRCHLASAASRTGTTISAASTEPMTTVMTRKGLLALPDRLGA